LIKIEDAVKRKFYEIQTIQGTWSVRELKRQIGSLYFERTGLSSNPQKLKEITNQNSNTANAVDFIKNPMVFEFLGISSIETVLEEDLENALLTNLQHFLMELGHGFCFEARQKRILIDDEYFYIDLVFYHRILKCHVLIELKAEPFSHENAGQLDTYLQYYKHEVMQTGDN
jgi:predicted nuclease of restriction endonuclease-like (RecB) superfamily